jgi:hypothetical protein
MAVTQQARGLVGQVAAGLRAEATDPRRLAEELIRETLGECGRFLGEGTAECPWAVIGPAPAVQFYALYVRGRELVQRVRNEPDKVVCVL